MDGALVLHLPAHTAAVDTLSRFPQHLWDPDEAFALAYSWATDLIVGLCLLPESWSVVVFETRRYSFKTFLLGWYRLPRWRIGVDVSSCLKQ